MPSSPRSRRTGPRWNTPATSADTLSEACNGIAVDAAGNAYCAGYTYSDEVINLFPVKVGPDVSFNAGTQDAFVAKVNPAGTDLVYAGYIGGAGPDWGNGVAVDSNGRAYVTGWTNSTETTFPVAVGPDVTHNGASTAFVARVAADGTALEYAGYVGGSGGEIGYGIAVDSNSRAYVTGRTNSTETTAPYPFPVKVGPDLTHNGGGDAFIARVRADGTDFEYAGYIGGIAADWGNAVAVDSAGNAYVAGHTESSQATFPEVGGPDLTFNGLVDAFVARVNPGGTALVYAGYIGGSGTDDARSVAVDQNGSAYVAGHTNSTEATFPEVVGPDLFFNGDPSLPWMPSSSRSPTGQASPSPSSTRLIPSSPTPT